MLTKTEGCDWDIEMTEMKWMKNDGAESDGKRKFGEGLEKVYDYGKAEKNGLVTVYYDVEEMKRALQMTNEG